MKNRKHSVDVLFMFILFAMFAILSVLIIYIGSGVYGRISANKQINEKTRTTVSYIVNKIRATDGEDVYIDVREDTAVLVLETQSGETIINNIIYEYDSKLMEMTLEAGDEFELKHGEILLDSDGVDFEKNGELLTITVRNENGKQECVNVFLGNSGR